MGSTQLPSFSIDSATTASLGSPRVLNSVSPKKRNSEHRHTRASSHVNLFILIFSLISFVNRFIVRKVSAKVQDFYDKYSLTCEDVISCGENGLEYLRISREMIVLCDMLECTSCHPQM